MLNSMLEGRKHLNAVNLGSVEKQGKHPETRKARFDLQCTGDGGEQFLIEMQRDPQANFFSRLNFYLHLMGSDQLPAGKRGDHFPLPELYVIADRKSTRLNSSN